MKSTLEERLQAKSKSRTRKIVNLINRLDTLTENGRVAIEEINEVLERNKHVIDSMVRMRLNCIREAN